MPPTPALTLVLPLTISLSPTPTPTATPKLNPNQVATQLSLASAAYHGGPRLTLLMVRQLET